MFTRAGQPTSLCCDAMLCGGGAQEGAMSLAQLFAYFQLLPQLPTSKLGPSGADSQVGGFVYILGPSGSLQQTPVRLGVSHTASTPTGVFSQRFEALFPHFVTWVSRSVLLPSCSSRFICTPMWDHLHWSAIRCFTRTVIRRLAAHPFHPATSLHPSYRSG